MAFTRAAKTNEITPGTVREFQVEGKAIALANATTFGLSGSVWTRNTRRGMALARRMRVGHASVNDHVLSASTPNLPWGGVGDSGYGRTRGREGLLDMVQTQVISAHRIARKVGSARLRAS